jgi:hypothetical protein
MLSSATPMTWPPAETRLADVIPFPVVYSRSAKPERSAATKPGWKAPLPKKQRGLSAEMATALWLCSLPEDKRERLGAPIPSSKYGVTEPEPYPLPAPCLEIEREESIVLLNPAPSYPRQRQAVLLTDEIIERFVVAGGEIQTRRYEHGHKPAGRAGVVVGQTSAGRPSLTYEHGPAFTRFKAIGWLNSTPPDWVSVVLAVVGNAKLSVLNYREGLLAIDPRKLNAGGIPKHQGPGTSRAHPQNMAEDIVRHCGGYGLAAPLWAVEPEFLNWLLAVLSFKSGGGRNGGQVSLRGARALLSDRNELAKTIRGYGASLAMRLGKALPGVESTVVSTRAESLFEGIARRIEGKPPEKAAVIEDDESAYFGIRGRMRGIAEIFCERADRAVDFSDSASFLRAQGGKGTAARPVFQSFRNT